MKHHIAPAINEEKKVNANKGRSSAAKKAILAVGVLSFVLLFSALINIGMPWNGQAWDDAGDSPWTDTNNTVLGAPGDDYIITGASSVYNVYRNGTLWMAGVNDPTTPGGNAIQICIDSIRADAGGGNCSITFALSYDIATSTASGTLTLVGRDIITFTGAWGTITLHGDVNPSNFQSAGTPFTIDAGVTVQSDANILYGGNTYTCVSVYGTLTMFGGKVDTSPGSVTAIEVLGGTLNVSGGTVKANTGIAISNTGTVNISEAVSSTPTLVTSARANTSSGTVTNSTGGVLSISGGLVENTSANGDARAIHNASAANPAVNISGGTVQIGSAGSGGTIYSSAAVYNASATGTIKISQVSSATTIVQNLSIGSAIYNNAGGNIEVSGGTISSSASNINTGTVVNNSTGTVTVSQAPSSVTVVENLATGAAINNVSTGKIYVSGGTISGAPTSTTTGTITNTAGEVAVSGGTVKNNSPTSGAAIHNASSVMPAAVTITGGIMEGSGGTSSSAVRSAAGIVNISGGELTNSGTSNSCVIDIRSGAIVNVFGDAKVTAVLGEGIHVYAGGTVYVYGNAKVTSGLIAAIYNLGAVYISDNAEITNSNNGNGTIHNRSTGTLEISGGIITNTSGLNPARTIDNVSTSPNAVTITGGIIQNTGAPGGSNISVVDNWGAGTINISGGIIRYTGDTICYPINNMSTGTINISDDAQVISHYSLAVYNYSTGHVTVSGGTISSADFSVYNLSGGTVTITGGIISSNYNSAVFNYAAGTVTITGGTLSSDNYSPTVYSYSASGSVYIGGDPLISGAIYAPKDRIIAIVSGADALTGSDYKIRIINGMPGDTAVVNGHVSTAIAGKFEYYNATYNLVQGSGAQSGNLILEVPLFDFYRIWSYVTDSNVTNYMAEGNIGGTLDPATGIWSGGEWVQFGPEWTIRDMTLKGALELTRLSAKGLDRTIILDGNPWGTPGGWAPPVLDIGAETLSFNNVGGTWGIATISGKVTSSASSTVSVSNTVTMKSYADIANTASAAISNSGTLTILGGLVTSANTNNMSGTIANSGTLIITGGTVQNTSLSANARAIYNSSAFSTAVSVSGTATVQIYDTTNAAQGTAVYNNSATGVVKIFGTATVQNLGIGPAINNVSSGKVEISGGLVTSANPSGNNGTIENSGTLDISGGTVRNTSANSNNIAVRSLGTVNVFGNATVTTGNGIAIRSLYATLNIFGNAEVTAGSGVAVWSYGGATNIYDNATVKSSSTREGTIYSAGTTGTLNISGGTVEYTSGTGRAIENVESALTITGGTVRNVSTGYAIYQSGDGPIKITGGEITTAGTTAIHTMWTEAPLTIGGNPLITGVIYAQKDTIFAIVSGPDALTGSNVYRIQIASGKHGDTAVVDGASTTTAADKFVHYNANFVLMQGAGAKSNDLILRSLSYDYVVVPSAAIGYDYDIWQDGVLLWQTPTSGTHIQDALDWIKSDANGNACSITFANGFAVDGITPIGTLDLDPFGGMKKMLFDGGPSGNDWGLITLKGSLTVTYDGSQFMELQNGVSMISEANISNKGSGTVIQNESAGNGTNAALTITGGTITGGTLGIVNYCGTVNIIGGIVESGGLHTIIINATAPDTATVNISGNATVRNTASTIFSAVLLLSANSSLHVSGGTIESTGSGAAVTIFDGSVSITGGTVRNTGGGYAINNMSLLSNAVTVTAGTVSTTGLVSIYSDNTTGIITLGGDPTITGRISVPTISSSDGVIHASATVPLTIGNVYQLEIRNGQIDDVAVIDGAPYAGKFKLVNPTGFVLRTGTGGSSDHLVLTKEWTVDFDSNGGSSITSQVVYDGDKAAEPSTPPELYSYIFIGWFDDNDDPYDFDTPIYEDITLYAKWEKDPNYWFLVTFDEDNGTTHSDEYLFGDILTKPTPDPYKNGLEFDAWYDTNTGLKWDFDDPVYGTMTLLAKYVNDPDYNWKVTFNPDNGDAATEVWVPKGTPVGEPSDPVKGSLVFLGWFTISDAKWDFNDNVTFDLNLKAKYKNDPDYHWKVTFDPDNGSATTEEWVLKGTPVGEPSPPTKADYTFMGWAYFNGTTWIAWDFDNDVESDMTLVAQWELSLVTVTFYDETGTIIISVQVSPGSPVPPGQVPDVSADKPNAHLVKWFTDSARTNEWKMSDNVPTTGLDLYLKYVPDPTAHKIEVDIEGNGDVTYTINGGSPITYTVPFYVYDFDDVVFIAAGDGDYVFELWIIKGAEDTKYTTDPYNFYADSVVYVLFLDTSVLRENSKYVDVTVIPAGAGNVSWAYEHKGLTITRAVSGFAPKNAEIEFTATAAGTNEFSHWSGSYGTDLIAGVNDTITVDTTLDIAIVAHFDDEDNMIDVTVHIDGLGTVEFKINGGGTILYVDTFRVSKSVSLVFIATNSDAPYEFEFWVVNAVADEKMTSSAYTFTDDADVYVLFLEKPAGGGGGTNSKYVDVSVTPAGSGTVSWTYKYEGATIIRSASDYAPKDAAIRFTAAAAGTNEFSHWSGDHGGNPIAGVDDTITVDTIYDIAIVAHFDDEDNMIDVTVHIDGLGTVEFAINGGGTIPYVDTFRVSKSVSLVFIATNSVAPYEFEFWVVDGVADENMVSNAYTFGDDADVYVLFLDKTGGDGANSKEVTVTIDQPGEGNVEWTYVYEGATIVRDGSGFAPKDAVITFTATPEYGYEFMYWSGTYGGSIISGTNNVKVIDTVNSIDITAHFIDASLAIRITVDQNGAGFVKYTINGGTMIDYVDPFFVSSTESVVFYAFNDGTTEYYFEFWLVLGAEYTTSVTPAQTFTTSTKVFVLFLEKPTGGGGGTNSKYVDATASPAGAGTVSWTYEYEGVTISRSGSDYAPKDAAIKFTANEIAPNEFSHWSGSYGSSLIAGVDDTITVNTTLDITIVAHFDDTDEMIDVTVHKDGLGTVEFKINGGGTIPYVDTFRVSRSVSLVFIATNSDAPYEFEFWVVDGVADEKITSSAYIFNDDADVYVLFLEKPTGGGGGTNSKYVDAIASPAGSGTVSWTYEYEGATILRSGSDYAPKDVSIDFVAAPNPGYKFTYWDGDLTGYYPSGTVTKTADISVTAYFLADADAASIIMTLVDGSGYATITIGSVTFVYDGIFWVEKGTSVQFLGTGADVNNVFDHWTILTYASVENPYTRTISENTEVFMFFVDKTTGDYVYVTVFSDPSTFEGSVDWSYTDSKGAIIRWTDTDWYAPYGVTVSFYAYAIDTDYVFSKYTGDVTGYNPNGSAIADGDLEVTAWFILKSSAVLITVVVETGNGDVEIDYGGYVFIYDGQFYVLPGIDVKFTPLPDANNLFDHWTVNSAAFYSNALTMPFASSAIVYLYLVDTDDIGNEYVEISVASDPAAGGSVTWSYVDSQGATVTRTDENGYAQKGATVTFTASANSGYKFTYWSGGASGYYATKAEVADDDLDVTAHFLTDANAATITITIETGDGDVMVTIGGYTFVYEGQFVVEKGTSVRFEADPATDNVFDHWTVLGDADAYTTSTYTRTITDDTDVYLYFVDTTTVGSEYVNVNVDSLPSVTYGSVIWSYVDSMGAKVTWTDIDGYAPYGADVTFTAAANDGYKFTYWSGDAEGYYASVVLKADDDLNAVAHFLTDANATTITISIETGDGEVEITIDGYTFVYDGPFVVEKGKSVRFEAYPETGNVFDHWTVIGDTDAYTTNPYTRSITGDTDVYVYFVDTTAIGSEYVNVSVDSLPSTTYGSVIWSYVDSMGAKVTWTNIDGYAPMGADVSFVASPNAGYGFSHWEGDLGGGAVPYVYAALDDVYAVAVFYDESDTDDYFMISIVDTDNGKIVWSNDGASWTDFPASGERYFKKGTTIFLLAVPDAGYEFSYWTNGVGAGEDNPYEYDGLNDLIVGAVFYYEDGEENVDYFTIRLGTMIGNGTVRWSLDNIVYWDIPASGKTFPIPTTVYLKAIPEAGWEFSYWAEGIGAGETNSYAYTAGLSTAVAAAFYFDGTEGIDYVVITLGDHEYGDILWSVDGINYWPFPASGEKAFPIDTPLWFSAVPDSTHAFWKWTGYLSGSDNPYAFDGSESMTVNALFTFTVTLSTTHNATFEYTITEGGVVTDSGTFALSAGGQYVLYVPHGASLVIKVTSVHDGYDMIWFDGNEITRQFGDTYSRDVNYHMQVNFELSSTDDPIPPSPVIPWMWLMLIGFGAVFFLLIFLDDDDEEIYGKVTKDGEGVAGAKVAYKLNGAAGITVADADGDYVISALEGDIVVITEASADGGSASELPPEIRVGKGRTKADIRL